MGGTTRCAGGPGEWSTRNIPQQQHLRAAPQQQQLLPKSGEVGQVRFLSPSPPLPFFPLCSGQHNSPLNIHTPLHWGTSRVCQASSWWANFCSQLYPFIPISTSQVSPMYLTTPFGPLVPRFQLILMFTIFQLLSLHFLLIHQVCILIGYSQRVLLCTWHLYSCNRFYIVQGTSICFSELQWI